MSDLWCRWVVVCALCAAAGGVRAAGAEDIEAERVAGAAAAAVQRVALEPRSWPGKGSPPSGSLEEYTRLLHEDLSGRDAQEDALGYAEAALRVVNWTLAVEAEPYATREFWGIGTHEDRAAWRALVKRARERLAEVAGLLESVPESSNEAEQERADALWLMHDRLEGFAEVFAALTGEAGAGDEAGMGRFAVLLDSEDAEVSAAARLWQGMVLERQGEWERMLRVLPMPLAGPPASRWDLFARWLRCRGLAEAGQPVAAAALLRRMEERSVRTGASAAEVAGSRWLRRQAVMRWRAGLGDDPLAVEAAEALLAEVGSGEEPVTLPRLQLAIPLGFEPPVLAPPASAPAGPDEGSTGGGGLRE